MTRQSSLTNKIRKEFIKKDIVTLAELYFIIEQDEGIEHPRIHLKHKIRSSLFSLKKIGKIKLIGEGTYQLVKKKDSEGFDPST